MGRLVLNSPYELTWAFVACGRQTSRRSRQIQKAGVTSRARTSEPQCVAQRVAKNEETLAHITRLGRDFRHPQGFRPALLRIFLLEQPVVKKNNVSVMHRGAHAILKQTLLTSSQS